MKYDLKLIFAYWSKHKRQAISFLTIFVILISYLFISFSMVRTELQRIYYESFYTRSEGTGYINSSAGNYNFILYDVQNIDIPQLKNDDIVSEYGYVYTIGYIGTDNYNYTAGAYPDEHSAEMAGSNFVSGNMPIRSGEIAISELALENMGITAKVGDNISLGTYNFDREKTGEINAVISGIFKDNGTNEHWDTNDRSSNIVFEPVIILPIEDIDYENSQKHIMMKVVDGDKIRTWSEERNNEFYDFLAECFDSSQCLTYGVGAYDSSYFTNDPQSGENTDGYVKSEKSYFYKYTGFGAAVLMTITMFCGLFAVIPERIKSFRLLWQVGCPIRRIRRIFFIEWIIFTITGLAAGLAISVIGYEILLHIQYFVFGLDICRAYKCEWGIKMVTYSPIVFSMAAACIASFEAYIIPFIRLGKLVVQPEQKAKNKSAFSPKRLYGYVHKIFGNFKIAAMQMLSLVLVLAISCTAYMFFSVNGKESNSNPQIWEKGKFYITDHNIDRREFNIDCTIEDTYKSFQAGLLDLDINSGYSYEDQNILANSGLFSECYAWSDVVVYAEYPDTADAPRALKPADFIEGEKEWYGLSDKNVFNVDRSILVNDEMLKDITSNAEYDENSIFIVSSGRCPFVKDDKISFFSANAVQDINAQFGYSIENKCQFEAVVSDIINLNSLKDNDLLNAILSEKPSDYIIVMPYSTAKAISLPQQNFEQIYMRYNENTNDDMVKSLVRTFNRPESYMSLKTINDCNNDYYDSMIKEYIIVFTIFGLLLLLSIIGYAQTIKLQIVQKEKQLRILHSLGMSEKSMKISIFKEMMATPVLAGIVSALSIYGLKKFLYRQYMLCEEILKKLDYVIPNNTSDETIKLSDRYVLQSRAFMTRYEMWKVPVWGLWAVLFILILICIGILIFRIAAHRSDSDLNKTE